MCFSGILSNVSEQLKQEALRMTASEIIWEKSHDRFLFHSCSRPEILEQLYRKIRENSQEKICVGVLFLILATETLYYRQFPGNFKYFRTAISRNLFERLLLEGFFSTEAVARKCQKSCTEKFVKFLKKTSVGVYIFSFLASKTTHHSQFPENFIRCFRTVI